MPEKTYIKYLSERLMQDEFYLCICMKALTGSKIANSLVSELCRRHYFYYVKASPTDVIPQHLELQI